METLNIDKQAEIEKFNASDKKRFATRVVDAATIILANIAPGKEYTADELSKMLNARKGTVQFGMGVSELNRMLHRHGYVITSRGFNQTKWKVLEPKRNRDYAKNKCAQHLNGIKDAAILAHATVTCHAKTLEASEIRKLEKTAEVMALRYILASRIR